MTFNLPFENLSNIVVECTTHEKVFCIFIAFSTRTLRIRLVSLFSLHISHLSSFQHIPPFLPHFHFKRDGERERERERARERARERGGEYMYTRIRDIVGEEMEVSTLCLRYFWYSQVTGYFRV